MKTTRTINPKWMSLRDFAKKYELELRTAQRYAVAEKLPCKKMGSYGAWYVDLDKWNKMVEIYTEHDEVCTSVVTGFEPGMSRYKITTTDDNKEILVIEDENEINKDNQ